jgi:hypothetical protein
MFALGLLTLLLAEAQTTAPTPVATDQVVLGSVDPVSAGEQIARPALAEPETLAVEPIRSEAGGAIGVDQLPEGLSAQIGSNKPKSNDGLEIQNQPSLFQSVSAAWHLVRSRGQQPTPLLMAQEVGSEQLARFLNNYPGSEKIFGPGSVDFPVVEPR